MKRFYREAAPRREAGGWTVTLDGKPIRTPGRSAFLCPTEQIAEAAAAEWRAQGATLRPHTMPVTRAVNTALERVAPQFDAVAAEVAAYGGTDLICYRAEGPEGLRARQAAAWDPLIDWAETRHGARLEVTTGVMPALQPETGQARLRAAVRGETPLGLTALHDLVALSGSLVIGLAVAEGALTAAEGWRRSRTDESWQAELWGEDAEAAAQAAFKQGDFEAAARLRAMLREA